MNTSDETAKKLFLRWYRLRTKLFIDGHVPDNSHSRVIDSYCTIPEIPVSVLTLKLGDSSELIKIPISNVEDLELDTDAAGESWVTIRKRDNKFVALP